MGKHMTQERIGFESFKISFMCNFYYSLVLLVISIIIKLEFRADLVLLGLVSGATEVTGKALAQNAIRIGPCGPAVAIVTMCSVWLVIVEVIIT